MKLRVSEIRRFYIRVDFDRYDWRFQRKHFRARDSPISNDKNAH